MTNEIATIAVTLQLVTNWTGVINNGKELGYVATNHNSEIHYQSETNYYTLKQVPSDIAIWRDRQTSVNITNYWWNGL